MITFLNVCACIIIAICFAIGSGSVILLNTYLVPISIVLWGSIFLFTFLALRKNADPEVTSLTLSVPICLMPTYVFIVNCALPDIFAMKGVEMVLGVLIELPMSVCFILLVSIAIGWIGTRFRKPIVAVPIVLIGNLILMLWVMNLGL